MKPFILLLLVLKPIHPRPMTKTRKLTSTKSTPMHQIPPATIPVSKCMVKPLPLFVLLLSSCGIQPQRPSESEKRSQNYTQTLPSYSSFQANRYEHQFVPLTPTRFPNAVPSDWISLSEQEIEDELVSSPTADPYLPTDHEETIRIQTILDEMYDQLTASAPDRFQSIDGRFQIPRPVIRIRQSTSINASVIRLGVCRGASILLQGKRKHSPENPMKTLIISIDFRGRMATFERHEIKCIDRLNEKLSASDIAHALMDDIAKNRCHWKPTAQGLEIEGNCIPEDEKIPKQVFGIHLTTTTNLFVITTGALNQFTQEKDLKFTLAHELAHYLYAHGSLVKSGHHYFYQQNLSNHAAPKPLAELALKFIGEKVVKLPSFRTQPIEGQEFHSQMFPYFREAMARLIEPACSNPEARCFLPCEGLRKVKRDSRQYDVFGQFPQSELTDKALEQYWLYEKNFTPCAKAIALLDQDTQEVIGGVSRKTASLIYWNADTAGKTNLYDLAIEMNRRIFLKDEEQNTLLAEALGQRVGYFTTEEEADNLALEWSTIFDIQANEAFKYWIDYAFTLKGKEQNAEFSFGYKRCAQFFRTYTDQIYKDQGPLVPVGSYSDPHHSLCYRAYRTLMRLDARYQVRLDGKFILNAVSRL
jgi:hypothetical protein